MNKSAGDPTVVGHAPPETEQALDARQTARELGVDYVLLGSVHHHAGRVRALTQLVKGDTGAHVWAKRFDRT